MSFAILRKGISFDRAKINAGKPPKPAEKAELPEVDTTVEAIDAKISQLTKDLKKAK